MTSYIPKPQVAVLDAGGQYCHLIARKVRELGVYAEVLSNETRAETLHDKKAIIISGGPNSVYEANSPTVDAAIFSIGIPVLGICYGQHLMAHFLGGAVRKGVKGEYGLAFLDIAADDDLFHGISGHQQVWMSHRDSVAQVPSGFRVTGTTETCAIAAMSDPARRLYGVQFHPEVVHTTCGMDILGNFLFRISGCTKDWNPRYRIPMIVDQIRKVVADRNVFFFVSGGVDSTVAFTLCLRSLGPERVRGIYVDTGLMREGETDFVRGVFANLAPGAFEVCLAGPQFLGALAGVTEPEQKRRIIGEEFVRIQQQVIESHHFMDERWILGQGTIYPDTIESGGTSNAAVIKTHHNRVPGILRLMKENRIVEPLSFLYKDEVREVGRELGVPAEMIARHPFPGPGLAIRCLCSATEAPVHRVDNGWLMPVRSVGVQGDSRSYAPVLALGDSPSPGVDLQAIATELINRTAGVNRIVSYVAGHSPLGELHVMKSQLSLDRVARLQHADAAVRRLSRDRGFDAKVWQFPVILIPAGTAARPDSVVLRPVDSVDGMTARSVMMEPALLKEISEALLAIDGVCAVFYDLTHKPPATIEWE